MATGLEKSEKMVSADSVHKDVRTLLSDEPRLVVVVVNDVSLDDVAASRRRAEVELELVLEPVPSVSTAPNVTCTLSFPFA